MAEYSFLTSKSWRVDATGRNPKQAFRVAEAKFNNSMLTSERGIFGFQHMFGELLKVYIKYDKNGIAATDAWRSL